MPEKVEVREGAQAKRAERQEGAAPPVIEVAEEVVVGE